MKVKVSQKHLHLLPFRWHLPAVKAIQKNVLPPYLVTFEPSLLRKYINTFKIDRNIFQVLEEITPIFS